MTGEAPRGCAGKLSYSCGTLLAMTTPTLDFTDQFAAHLHSRQVDKAGRPYVDHVRAVARRLAVYGEWMMMAGLLHDAIEDTDVTAQLLREMGYPEVVVEAVDAVSRRVGESYWDLIERAAAHPLGRLVKLADNSENSDPARLALLSEEEREWLRAKYAKARDMLLAAAEADKDRVPIYGPPAPAQRGMTASS